MKKLGPLEKGIVFQPTSDGLIARAISDVAKSTKIEHKFKLLFAKFNVEEGNWKHLAVCLAIKYEIGLKPIRPPGPKSGKGWLWTAEHDKQLLSGIDQLKLQTPKISVRAACVSLSKSKAFRGQSFESLRSRLKELTKVGG